MAGQGGSIDGDKIVCQELTIQGKNLEYVGTIDIEQRGKLMSEATALVVPTLYIGPFEGVSAEALFCGTPIITPDFGCFTENNVEGLTGYRCHTIKEYVEACNNVKMLVPKQIKDYAMSRFSMDVVAPMYTRYFERLRGLERGGFYEL